MKKLIVLFAGLFMMTIAVQNVNAQNQDDASALTSANIIAPIKITKTVDLDFGKIVTTAAAGTVVVSPEGARGFNDGALIFLNDVNYSAAEFEVEGQANANYSIVVTNDTFDVTRDGGSETMEVSAITTSPTPNGQLNGSGLQIIKVGATLSVDGGQEPGLYTNVNELEITVAYN
jgi:hypothetical protein